MRAQRDRRFTIETDESEPSECEAGEGEVNTGVAASTAAFASRAESDDGNNAESSKRPRLGASGRTPPFSFGVPPCCASGSCAAPPLPSNCGAPMLSDLEALGADDEEGLNAEQKARADSLRLSCESLPGGAQSNRFRLLRDGSRWKVECLLCKSRPTFADHLSGGDGLFLANFEHSHLKSSKHLNAADACASAAAAAGGTSSNAGAHASPSTLPPAPLDSDPHNSAPSTHQQAESSAVHTPPPLLTSEQLEQLATRDAEGLSPEQVAVVQRYRQLAHEELEHGGAFINSFHLRRSTGATEDEGSSWEVECHCCGVVLPAARTGDAARVDGVRFLYNFYHRHLKSNRHKAHAADRFAAMLASVVDVTAAAAAAAQRAAAEGWQAVLQVDVGAAERMAHAARAAAERAAEAARVAQAAAQADSSQQAATTLSRGAILPDVIQPSQLEVLVATTPSLDWIESDDGVRIGVRCAWCRHDFTRHDQGHGSPEQLLPNINTHLHSSDHRKWAAYGGRTTKGCFFGPLRKGPAPPPLPPPDRSTLCLGYHFKTLRIGEGADAHDLDLTPLLELRPHADSGWHPEPYFRRSFRRSLGVVAGSPAGVEQIEVVGTFRSSTCSGFCLDASGRPLHHQMCDHCRRLPKLDAFRKLAVRHNDDAERDQRRVRFDYLSPERRLLVMRALAAKVHQLRWAVWRLRAAYLSKCTRVRKLQERLDEFAGRGDVKAIISDIVKVERAGKWQQRPALFSFIRDLIHAFSLRDGAEGKRSANMRWATSSKRIFAVMRKYGGPRTTRFWHETLEAPHDRVIRREWLKEKVHFDPTRPEAVFEFVGRIYASLKTRLGIKGPVLYELSEDETTVPGASQYNERLDSIVGFCGERGPNHCCDPSLSIVIGDGDVSLANQTYSLRPPLLLAAVPC